MHRLLGRSDELYEISDFNVATLAIFARHSILSAALHV